MDNCKKFSDLTVRLQELFKSASYSESTVKDMDFILRAFTSYMNANGIDEYSPYNWRKHDSLLRRNTKGL